MRRLFKRLAQTRRPEFIFSLSYFSRKPAPHIALHRALWLGSCRSPKHALVQVIGSCRWYGVGVWRASYRFSKRVTQQQLDNFGLTRCALFKELIRYGLLYSLAPHQYIRHQLYQSAQKNRVMHFIYDHQLPYFHHYIHQNIVDYQYATTLIGNKHRFADALQKLNLPTVMSTLLCACDLQQDLSPLFQKKSVFCKPNRGSQSQDAFLIQYDEIRDQYSLEPIHGEVINQRHDIERYLTNTFCRHQQMILQPFVQDHDDLVSVFSSQATTTVRLITGRHALCDVPVVLYLQLEIAKGKNATGKQKAQQYYTILPLHWETLDVDPIFQEKYPTRLDDARPITDALKKMLRDSQAYCIEAHQHLLALKSVAFDVCLSQSGPVILEANFNWSVALLYQVIAGDPLSHMQDHPAARWLRRMYRL